MRLTILAVGSPRYRAIAEAIRWYEERTRHYFRLDSIEVSAASGHGGNADRARRLEAEAILRRLPADRDTWAITRNGEHLASRDLADRLADMGTYGHPGVVFVIGGAFGLHADVAQRCCRSLALSALTLPHDLARLLLAEQLYRAGTLLRGEPYHKGG